MTLLWSRLVARVRRQWPALIDLSWFQLYKLPPLSQHPATTDGLVRRVADEDLPALAICREVADMAEGVTTFRARLEAGCRGYCLVIDGTVSGYLWMAPGTNRQEDHDSYRIHLGATGAYLFDAYLHAATRGRGFYRALVLGAQQQERAFGIQQVYLTIDNTNTHSRNVHLALGAVPVETVGFLLLFGWRFHVAWGVHGWALQLDPPGLHRDFLTRVEVARLPDLCVARDVHQTGSNGEQDDRGE